MKLLSISGILPIKGLVKENDIIFQIYDHYRSIYPKTKVHFIRTIVYSNFFLAQLKDKWDRYYQAKKRGTYQERGYDVTVFPHFIFQSNEDVFTFLSKAAYYQNLGKLQKFKSFDLIHAQRIFPEGYLAYKLSEKYSIPYVLTVRKERNYFNDSASEKRARQILGNASHITVLNKKIHSFFNEKYPGKTTLIPHGIEKRFFSDQLGETGGPVQILTVAKLWGYKRIKPVIKALSNFKGRYDFKYIIVGKGPQKQSIEQYIQKHGMQEYVEMIPRIPHEEIPKMYADSDIFVLASYPETFGRVYFEAMAAGIPIICSKNSGVDGLFVDGESGLSVDHKRPEALQDALEKLIQDKQKRLAMGKAGQEVVLKYTWPKVVKKYHSVYEQAVQNY